MLVEGFFAGDHGVDPWAHLSELRARGPVVWNDVGGWWLATHHAPVQEASVDPARFCSGEGILVFEIGTTYPSPPTMMHTDPPEHTRYRQLVAPAFRPSAMRAIEPRLAAHAARLLDAVATGEPVDVVEQLAVPYPLLVICELLGVPWEDWERFYLWSEISIPGATAHTAAERQALQAEMIRYLVAAVAEKREHSADDVFSLLAAAGLSELEVSMFAVQLLAAGNETVRNTLSAGLAAFAEHPGEWRRLRADRSLLPTAVEEILRWATPVIYFMRTAVADTSLGGADIAAGEHVVLLYASANRDEAEFGPSAAGFDIGRSPNHHVAFGFGAHYCIGAALARREITAVLDVMLDRFERIEPAGPVERTRSPVIAGIRRAPLTLVPG